MQLETLPSIEGIFDTSVGQLVGIAPKGEANVTFLASSNPTGSIIAGTTRTQAGATQLGYGFNRIDTSTAPAAGSLLGDGVVLPSAFGGREVVIVNNTANPIVIYGSAATSDTINGIAAATGLVMPPNSLDTYFCSVTGSWNVEAGVGYAGQLNTVLALSGISAAGTTQGTATVLTADFNQVTTATANQGVVLPPAKQGLDVLITNIAGLPVIVYANGSDTVDGNAGATGVIQMNNSNVIYTCFANGTWGTNGLASGWASAGGNSVLQTMQFADAVSAAGTTQATGTQLTAQINTISTVGAGAGVNLPKSAPGVVCTIINTGANPLLVYPYQGSSDTINGIAATQGVSMFRGVAATFNSTAAGAWTTQPSTTNQSAYQTNSTVGSTTLAAAQISGGSGEVFLNLTGTQAGAANFQLPTVSQLVAAMHSPTIGSSYTLRVINSSAGAFTNTITTNTGWTLNGTMTVAQNTFRDFIVTLNSLTTATIQNGGTGTWS